MRLNFSKYINCSGCFVFNVVNFNKKEEDIFLEVYTNYSHKFEIPFSASGLLKKVIREKQVINDAVVNKQSEFYNFMKNKVNF